MELLRVEHLSKIYGAGENQVKALDDVSLSVEKGEFVASCRGEWLRKIHTASSAWRC